MPRLSRWSAAVALVVAAPLAAQQPAYLDQLPGAGRPIDVASTTARRQRLMDRLGDAVVVIPAAHEREGEAYGEYPQDTDFRQHNNFFYFSQLEAADAWIVLNASSSGADQQILLLPPRIPAQERWTGVRLGPEPGATRVTGFEIVLPTTALDSVLAAAKARHVPLYLELDRTTMDESVLTRLRADSASTVIRNARPTIDSMRLVKDAAEIATLRTAARISAEAHAELMQAAHPNMWEYEMEAVVEAGFRRRGADRLGYPSIVGSGINATTLHYDVNRRQALDGELVVVDAAAEYAQYTADVTRTFPTSGRFTARQRAIYDLVLGAQQAAMDSVRPGVTIGRLSQIAFAYLRDHSGDLCPQRPDEAPIGNRKCDRYMIHGLSHWIGMDVHDVGPYQVPLAPGMVFTIEPGIYIPGEALGVRIEDDILVTPTGYENLSSAAPRTAADIERLMQQPRQRAGNGSGQ